MATLDNLCEWMNQRKVERAVMVNDKPAKLYVNGKESSGDVWPMKKLHNFAWEILPDDLRPQLAGETNLVFSHFTDSGRYNIFVQRSREYLKVIVEPEICWFCQKRKPDNSARLHHKMIYKVGDSLMVLWDRKTLQIPRCSQCKFWHGFAQYTFWVTLLLPVIAFFVFDNVSFEPQREFYINIIKWIVFGHFAAHLLCLPFGKTIKLKKHPDYLTMKQAGYGNVLY